MSDAEFNSEDGGNDIDLDTPLPLHSITFEIDADIDITSQALRDMVATEHSVQRSAAPQLLPLPKPVMIRRRWQHNWTGIGRFVVQQPGFNITNQVFCFNNVNNIILTC